MRIAVNICFAEPVAGIPIYYRLLLQQLVQHSPEHQFSLFTNEGAHLFDEPLPNTSLNQLAFPTGKLPLTKISWLRRLNRHIMAGQPDLVINCNPFVNLVLPKLQVLLLDETAVELFTDGLQWRPRRALLRNLALAKSTIIPSRFDEERFMAALRIQTSQIKIIGTGPQLHALQLGWEKKEKVKERFSFGKEYFLATPVRLSADSIVQLLKAFSLFKKRQHSNLQLLLPAKMVEHQPDFDKKLGTYKYREDVVVLPRLTDQEQLELIGAAYGIIDPTDHLFSGAMTLQAFESGTPVILPGKSRSVELATNAALQADLREPQELANQMMLLYKDEHLRKRLVAAGSAQLEIHNWQTAALKLKDALQALIQDS